MKDVTFGYGKKEILSSFSLEVSRGEIVAIMGPSGSGKSTLLNVIDGTLIPQKGELVSPKIAAIFQDPYSSFHPHYTIVDQINDVAPGVDLEKLLDHVGLSMDHLTKLPKNLSGGQLQRCSIIRALAMKPDLILADEPTSALDNFVGLEVMKLLVGLLDQVGIVLVTHDDALASWCANRIIKL